MQMSVDNAENSWERSAEAQVAALSDIQFWKEGPVYSAPNPCDPYFILFAVQQQWNNYCGLSGVKYLAPILTKCSWGECDPVLYKSEARFWSSVCFYYCALHGFRANVLVMRSLWLTLTNKRESERGKCADSCSWSLVEALLYPH